MKDQLLAVWKQLADRYKDRPNLIYYEILNESHGISDAIRTYFEDNGIAWTLHEYGGGFGIFELDSYKLFGYDVNVPIIEALGLTPPPQSEYQFLADSIGFTIYDDYITQGIFNNSWLSTGDVDYY